MSGSSLFTSCRRRPLPTRTLDSFGGERIINVKTGKGGKLVSTTCGQAVPRGGIVTQRIHGLFLLAAIPVLGVYAHNLVSFAVPSRTPAARSLWMRP